MASGYRLHYFNFVQSLKFKHPNPPLIAYLKIKIQLSGLAIDFTTAHSNHLKFEPTVTFLIKSNKTQTLPHYMLRSPSPHESYALIFNENPL